MTSWLKSGRLPSSGGHRGEASVPDPAPLRRLGLTARLGSLRRRLVGRETVGAERNQEGTRRLRKSHPTPAPRRSNIPQDNFVSISQLFFFYFCISILQQFNCTPIYKFENVHKIVSFFILQRIKNKI